MKINFIVPEISRTGGMNIIFQYANRLTDRGHEVTLYSRIVPLNNYKGQIKRYFIKYQIESARKLLKRGRKPEENIYPYKFEIKYVLMLNNLFIGDADATVATAWTTAYAVNSLNRKKGRQYYLIQDYEIWNSSLKHANRSYKLPLNRIVVSEYLKNFLKDKLGVDSKKILIGLDYTRFHNENKVFGKAKTVLFMDHILPNKNTEGAVRVISKLHEIYPSLEFTCFGIKKYHSMPDYVKFTENPDDETITKLYSAADVFLFPSLYEGFGATPAEAMACKCAVVANAVAAVPEYTENGKSAIWCNPHNETELFNGACFLIDNPKILERISIEGYEHVKKILNWDRSVDEFEKCLEAEFE